MIAENEAPKLKKLAAGILKKLKKFFPHAKIALNYFNNWELLVAVVLSAQCTDKKVNEVTEKLFKKYRTLDDYIKADTAEFEKDIKSTGFYRNKAKSILAAAKAVKEKYGGKLPKSMEEMLKIPGIGRKSANVILGNAYGIVEGIAVDTHVMRLSKKLGLTENIDPAKIEQDLMKIAPKDMWIDFAHMLILRGREMCTARPHTCEGCPLGDLCPDRK